MGSDMGLEVDSLGGEGGGEGGEGVGITKSRNRSSNNRNSRITSISPLIQFRGSSLRPNSHPHRWLTGYSSIWMVWKVEDDAMSGPLP